MSGGAIQASSRCCRRRAAMSASRAATAAPPGTISARHGSWLRCSATEEPQLTPRAAVGRAGLYTPPPQRNLRLKPAHGSMKTSLEAAILHPQRWRTLCSEQQIPGNTIKFTGDSVGLIVRGKKSHEHEPGLMEQHADCILSNGAPVGFL